MTTNVDVLKDSLYDKIADINDEEVLNAIKTLVDNIQIDVLEESITQKRDLTSYIKEWAKSI
ncbi:hypothetical protein [Tenacibaculum soleae]|uniref:Uncharacterized protein n=1 Tax=Tenacibaculum soleae TaxID=447689 RepID=A0A1B9Y0B6_9FLAO|nr:hypothetical protein [Tenacibaculum soleae]MDO6742959.1 hypothetical protein [Tenacibaculum soleae]MDO6811358.1 hypothetical protein [Tenacibaculum soleae]OCK43254.1 hypothetical protein BA195_00695 [Tenacibaculum soleae]